MGVLILPEKRLEKYPQIPAPTLAAIEAGPMNPENALLFGDINRLLDPGYHNVEIGYCYMSDGSGYVAVLTEMIGISGDMIDWWFEKHANIDGWYPMWYPEAHFSNRMTKIPEWAIGVKPYWHTVHCPIEDIGTGTERLTIHFLPPQEFGFDVSQFSEADIATVVCGVVGSPSKGIAHTLMCHLVRNIPGGVEMRSRFWIGLHIEPYNKWFAKLFGRALNTRFVRNLAIPRGTPRCLALHCAQEYLNLAYILPNLYAEYGQQQVLLHVQ